MIKRFLFYNHKYWYLILISLIFHLLAAYFSQGFYEQDEHFSILEPITFKLGENATLGWDFFLNYDKQWFLSFFYYYLVKFLEIFGVVNPFQWAFIIRLTSSILGWLSIICLIHFTLKQISNKNLIQPLFFISSLFWFYPYIHARPASENLSIIFLIFAITIFSFFSKNRKILILCGLFFGFSFAIRYTNIFILVFFAFWAILFRKVGIIEVIILTLSFLFICLISVLIDYWGYGVFFPLNSLVVINYFKFNDYAMNTGYFNTNTEAWWFNFYFIIKEFLPPLSILIIICIILFWIFNLNKMITWITLPYFIFLSTIPHKETRFLFPILMLSPYFIIMVFDKFYRFKKIYSNKFLLKTTSKIIVFTLIFINCFALIILSLFPANNSTLLYKYLYENKNNFNKIYTIDKIPYKKSDLLINFYRNKDIYFTKITSEEECKKIGNEINTIDNFKVKNLNKETEIYEIQKYSYPKWVYKYSVICNLETYFNDLIITKKTYFLINKFKNLSYLIENKNMLCERVYSTIPSIFIYLNIENLFKNLSSWNVYECKKI